MSDYALENRQEVVNVLTERVISNAPVRELLRVYSEAVTAAIANLSDDDVIRSIAQAGYSDILEAFNLTVPEAPAEEAAPEGEAVPA
jgi:predicted HTH transcriptional regulator